MKKILIPLVALLAIGGIVYAGYIFSTKKQDGVTPPATTGGLPEATPIETGGAQAGGTEAQTAVGLKTLSVDQFAFFSVASDTSITAVGLDGKIFKVSSDGSSSPLSSSALENFISARFSSDAQKIIFSFGSPESKQFSVFDVTTRSWTPLANNTVAASWKPLSHTLTYATEKTGLKTVSSLDFDSPKAKPQLIFSLRMEDIVLNWLTADKISIAQKSSGLVKGSVLVFDLKKKTFSSPATDVPGLSLAWDLSASRALEFFGSQTARGGDFRIISAGGETINKFQFITLPEKCLFIPEAMPTSTVVATSTKAKTPPPLVQIPAEKNIVCAVPANQADFLQNIIPDEYYKRAFFTTDNIYGINLDDGTASILLSSTNKSVDVQNPIIFGKKLFFLNRADNKIYSLPLPE